MVKDKLKSFVSALWMGIKNSHKVYESFVQTLTFFIKSWWHLLLIALVFVVGLYYPLGAYFIHDIDKNPNYEVKPLDKTQSAAVETLAFVINREVNDKMWTPNLPFFFPSYFLDDMPNFQLGMMDAVRVVALSLSRVDDFGYHQNLKKASELLAYPGTVWMFALDNNLLPAPSATRQYRKARNLLVDFNRSLADGEIPPLSLTEKGLAALLQNVAQSMNKSVEQLQTQVREHASDFWDGKADDVFFYNQGKLYAYLLLLKGVGEDYKNVIVNYNAYQPWTALLADLEAAVELNPKFVRNAGLSQSFAPNHLAYLALFALKAQKIALGMVSLFNHFEK